MRQKTLVIRAAKGKAKGQYYYTLNSANNEVMNTSEIIKHKKSIKKVWKNHFSAFKIVDTTLKPVRA